MNLTSLTNNLKLNKTPILITALVALTILLVVLAIFPNRHSISLPRNIIPKVDNAKTLLSIENPLEVMDATASAKTYSANIDVDSSSDKLTAVQIELKYDPQVLTQVDITPGNFFQNPVVLLKRIDGVNGTVSYALGVTGDAVSGKGVVAKLEFSQAPAPISDTYFTSIDFLSKSTVAAEDSDKTVLKKSTGVGFSINSEGIVPASPESSSSASE